MAHSIQSVFSGDADLEIKTRVNALLLTQERVLIAIDGYCCAGKTTMASRLGSPLEANVFHMDDFFLQPQMRTPERLSQPGGNVNAERFLQQVLAPASRGETVNVCKYDCQADRLLTAVPVQPRRVAIVEGAYALHPLLAPYYDLKVFCRIDPALQSVRILARNGSDALPMFQQRWIPLENKYFQALDILEQCDIIVDSMQN